MKTTVTHVRLLKHAWWNDEQYVYIGRKNNKYGEQGLEAVWSNPIFVPLDADTQERERICTEYHRLLLGWIEKAEFRRAVRQLSGKVLVGFDYPKRGHGDPLALLADQLQADAEQWGKSLTQAAGTSIEELEYRDRLRKQEIIHAEMSLAFQKWRECTEKIRAQDTQRTGMPEWFRTWRTKYLKPVIDKDKELFPSTYRLVESKPKFRYDRDIPEFYAFPQRDVYDE